MLKSNPQPNASSRGKVETVLNCEQVMFETAASRTIIKKRAADGMQIVVENVYKTTYLIGRSKHTLKRRMESLSSVLDLAGHYEVDCHAL